MSLLRPGKEEPAPPREPGNGVMPVITDEIRRRLDASALQKSGGHTPGCGCLACDGWRFRALTKGR